MYKLKNKQLIHLKKGKHHDGGGLYIRITRKGKDDVTEKSENKLFKYSHLSIVKNNTMEILEN